MVRFELTSLPPGVQAVDATLARGTRLPTGPQLTCSATCDALPSSRHGPRPAPPLGSSCRTAGVAQYLEAKAGAPSRPACSARTTAARRTSAVTVRSEEASPANPWASSPKQRGGRMQQEETARLPPAGVPPPSPSVHLSPPSSPLVSPPPSPPSPPPLASAEGGSRWELTPTGGHPVSRDNLFTRLRRLRRGGRPAPPQHAMVKDVQISIDASPAVEARAKPRRPRTVGLRLPEGDPVPERRSKRKSGGSSDRPPSSLQSGVSETELRASSRASRYSFATGSTNMPPRRVRELTRAIEATPGRASHANPGRRRSSGGSSRGSAGSRRRSGGAPPPATPALAWPVDRSLLARGWRLRCAWLYNGALVVGGLLWLALLLRAYDVGDVETNLDGFWRTYAIALTQGLLLQDTLKVPRSRRSAPALASPLPRWPGPSQRLAPRAGDDTHVHLAAVLGPHPQAGHQAGRGAAHDAAAPAETPSDLSPRTHASFYTHTAGCIAAVGARMAVPPRTGDDDNSSVRVHPARRRPRDVQVTVLPAAACICSRVVTTRGRYMTVTANGVPVTLCDRPGVRLWL